MDPIVLEFDSYKEARAAWDAVFTAANAERGNYAAGKESVTLMDGTELRFKTRTRQCRCVCGHCLRNSE